MCGGMLVESDASGAACAAARDAASANRPPNSRARRAPPRALRVLVTRVVMAGLLLLAVLVLVLFVLIFVVLVMFVWRLLVVMLDAHDAEHPGLHVIEQMAMERPRTKRVRGHSERSPGTGGHAQRVLAHEEFARLVLEVAPEAVQVNRVRHHRVVDQDEAHALAVAQCDRLRAREWHAVERPEEALHVPREVQLDRAHWRTAIGIWERRAQIGICEHAPAVVAQTDAR